MKSMAEFLLIYENVAELIYDNDGVKIYIYSLNDFEILDPAGKLHYIKRKIIIVKSKAHVTVHVDNNI